MTVKIVEIGREHNPFSRAGMVTDGAGRLQYNNQPASLAAMLQQHAEQRPQVEAVVECGGRRITYGQLWTEARKIAAALQQRGLATGDRVGILYPAGADWVLSFWGIVLAGGIAVAPNTRLPQADVDHILQDAGARLTLGPGAELPDCAPVEPVARDGDDVVALFYTSGTTGKPKGVPFTQTGLMASTRNNMSVFRIDPESRQSIRTLISVPLFHVTGCNTQMMVMMYVGGTSVIMPAFSKQEFLAQLQAERINHIITVPAIYAMILQAPEFKDVDTSGIRWLAYGGAPIAPSLVRALKAAFPNAIVANGFGMTETTTIITALPDEDAIAHADSVGYAVPAIDIAVAVEQGDELVGELLARGANVTAGYWHNEAATREAHHDGWYWTGDIVRVDDAGRVFLIDRKKDIIIRGGENISSVAIEAALAGVPGVAEAAALAVPDEILGEKVGALVRLADPALTPAQLIEHCRGALAKYMVPQYVAFTQEPLPRSAAGKILKRQLREQVQWGQPLW